MPGSTGALAFAEVRCISLLFAGLAVVCASPEPTGSDVGGPKWES